MKQIIVDNQVTDYFITEEGKCWSNKTNGFLKGQKSNSGYLNYNLTLPSGKKKRMYAHRLVAQYFIPNPDNLNEVNHKDGNKDNNNVNNLEWTTSSDNQRHALNLELRKYPHVYCFDKNGNLLYEFKNIAEAATRTGVCRSMIQQETQKEQKSLTGGYYWSLDSELKNIVNYPNVGISKEVQCFLNGKFYKTFPSANAAARWLGVNNHSHIGECCRGKIKSYKGFTWKYTQDIV